MTKEKREKKSNRGGPFVRWSWEVFVGPTNPAASEADDRLTPVWDHNKASDSLLCTVQNKFFSRFDSTPYESFQRFPTS